MSLLKLSLTNDQMSQEYVLIQAWKKAHDYIRRHNWYSDVLELDLTNANLQSRLNGIAQDVRSRELLPNPLRLVLAPKNQQWELKNNKWVPAKGTVVEEKLRPLAHLTVRDQVIGTAFMMLLADTVETRQGDPRRTAMKAREERMVSYGHRLFCDEEDGQLQFRWGNSVVYRQYFQDYQAFVARPQEVVDAVFGDSQDWAIVYADLSQFYDRVRPVGLYNKIEKLAGPGADAAFLRKFRSFFAWQWHQEDIEEAGKYAKRTRPRIDGFDRIALPQGLVASGFFSNAFLIDFDEAVCREFDQWHDEGSWQLIDFCRYVDDMRIVIRLGEKLRNAKEAEIIEFVSKHLLRLLQTHAEGMLLNPKKCSIVLGRDAAAGSIRVSTAMRRINHNTSGTIDLVVGEETIDLIEGLFFSRQEEPLNFEDKFRDTFFAAKPDVRDETVARFSANRFRQTYRALRPMCEDNPESSDESLLPSLSREVLDNKAAHFCRRLIERWVRDPSNMRLLRVALDVCPDPKALEVVLDFLGQHVNQERTRRPAIRRIAWYCAAELLKAGASETGLVADVDCLPANIDLKRYQEVLAEFAERVVSKRDAFPWYLEQQAHLFLACINRQLDPRFQAGSSVHLKEYVRLREIMAGRNEDLIADDVVPFVLLQKHLQNVASAARTFLSCFRKEPTTIQRTFLRRVFQEDAGLAAIIRNEMTSEEQSTWSNLFLAHGIAPSGGFPESIEALPAIRTSYAFLSVARSPINPFQQEYAALQFALVLINRRQQKPGHLFPSRIKISAENWRDLCSDRFPIHEGAISVEFDGSRETDVRFAIPPWITKRNVWRYQLGQILRVLLTGLPDYTASHRRPHADHSQILYMPYSSSWMRRRYGLFNGRNAFGPLWLPISSWLGSLLSRLLEWPGFARSDFDVFLPDQFEMPDVVQVISRRLAYLERIYGRASRTAFLPILTPKTFMRPKSLIRSERHASLKTMRVGVVQTVIPRKAEFQGDAEQNNPNTRQRLRRHLSAVLGGVHRMLQVRETHCDNGSGIELLVLPELSIHRDDVASHLVPFVNQHRCMVFAGIIFHAAARGGPLVNSGYWIIPTSRPFRGLQIEIVEQGKFNLTAEEQAIGIGSFRPAQWILDFVGPLSRDPLWSMSGSICYDATDLRLAADLRDVTHMYVVPALNKDVGTFDNMAAALHYHMFQHVIVANTGEYGGSTCQVPFSDRNERLVFHTHGNEQAAISFFEVNLDLYRNSADQLKTPPAGHTRTN